MEKSMKWYRQTPGYCGPASLRIALTKFGKNYSEDELAVLCKSTRDGGTNHADLISALKEIGMETKSGYNGAVSDLKMAITYGSVIVGWWKPAHYPPHDEEECDHFSVVCDVTSDFVYMLDPEYEGEGKVVELLIPIKEFEELWYDFDENGIKCERWYLIILGPKKEEMK
jgi:predicted double-glycine peptidase